VTRKRLFCIASVFLPFVLVVAGEAGVRLWERWKNGNWEKPYYMRGEWRPSYVFQRSLYPAYRLWPGTVVRGEGGRERIRINQWGYRDDDLSPEKRPDEVRIVCYGGSSTYGYFISENSKTWPQQLEQHLSKKVPGIHWNVINAGVPGYTRFHNLVDFESLRQEIDPDCIIIYGYWNDLACSFPNHEGEFRSDYTHRRTVTARRAEQWWEHSFLLIKLKSWLKVGKWKQEKQSRKLLWAESELADDVYGPGLLAFEGHMRSFVAVAHANNVLVVLIPQILNVDYSLPKKEFYARYVLSKGVGYSALGLKRAEESFRAVFQSLGELPGVICVNSEGMLARDEIYFKDECHMTDEGAEQFAAHLAVGLLKEPAFLELLRDLELPSKVRKE